MLQVMAVFAAYLVFSITGVSAFQISLFTSDGQEISTEIPDFAELIEKEFSYPYANNYQYVELKLNAKGYNIIKKVYVFRCKGYDPIQCIGNGIQPVISVNSGQTSMAFDETYKWNDVSESNVANFIILVKLDVNGKQVWTGSLDSITKTGIRTFEEKNYDIDKISVYLKSGVAGSVVKNFIENYYSIPFDKVDHVRFSAILGSTVEKLYELSGNQDDIDPEGTRIPSFFAKAFDNNEYSGLARTWSFVFPSDSKIANPVVFYSSEAGPPTTGGARLVIDNWEPQIVKCDSSDVMQVEMHVENATGIGYFQSYYYEIDGVRAPEGAITCSVKSPNESIYAYACSIPVKYFPVCNGPKTSTIRIYFNYLGGVRVSGEFPVTLQAAEPKVIINSLMPNPFDCGIDDELAINVSVSNEPQGVQPNAYYTFDGVNYNMLTCAGANGFYACSIPEESVCGLLREDLNLVLKFVYGETEAVSLPAQLYVTFPPPSLGVDTVTPQTIEAGNTTKVKVLLHVNYPDTILYNNSDFNYKYLNKDFQPVTCSLDRSYTNIKYYECDLNLEVPSNQHGVKTLTFRLDGYQEGSLKQLSTTALFEIIPPSPEPTLTITSTSSPLDCLQDSSLAITAKVENMEGTPETYYSVDSGETYKPTTCVSEGNVYTCTIDKNELCDLMSNSVQLALKFVYPGKELVSNSQKIYLNLPEPHIQVYSIQPDKMVKGKEASATVNLYVQYPKLLGENPKFSYEYLQEARQGMSCAKVSSTGTRDFYQCTNVKFDVPSDYSGDKLPVIFSIDGTTITYPMTIPLMEGFEAQPWLEIVSSTPSRIEIPLGNETKVEFYVTVHNAEKFELKHQATVMRNSWITSGECKEADVDYDFICSAILKPPKTTKVGKTPLVLTLRVSDDKSYDISNTTDVYVLPPELKVEIESVSPQKLYCEGSKQENPEQMSLTARVTGISKFTVMDESIEFNGKAIAPSGGRYCSTHGQTITCNVPVSELMDKVPCGENELAPGKGSRYYSLSLTFIIKKDDGETTSVFGSKDVEVVARPLEPFIEIIDDDIEDGMLKTPINCLGSNTLKLGDKGGYVRIRYADLLHPQPKPDDLKWSFRLEAQDSQGKLTKGMGVSPENVSTVCKFLDYQRVGAHRYEDYECSVYLTNKLFQRCANGEGTLYLTASSGTGKKATGSIDVSITRGEDIYNLGVEIIEPPPKEIICQIQSYDGTCSLASYSNLNVTVRIYNRNSEVGLPDLKVYGFDAKFKNTGGVDPRVHVLGNCRPFSQTSKDKFVCPFQIGPTIKLSEDVTEDKDTYAPIVLKDLNITLYVKYANDLMKEGISKVDGSITLKPQKTDAVVNMEKMKERMLDSVSGFVGIFKWFTLFISTCSVCALGTSIIKPLEGAKSEESAQQNVDCSSFKDEITCKNKGCEWVSGYCTKSLSNGQSASSGSSGHDWVTAVSAIGLGMGMVLLALKLLGGGKERIEVNDEYASTIEKKIQEKKDEIGKYMKRGILLGFGLCVIPEIIGKIGLKWGSEEHKGTYEGLGGFGERLGNICMSLLRSLPLILMIIRVYIDYLQMQACIDMASAQIESSSAAYSDYLNTPQAKAMQAQQQAQMSINMMNTLMQCYTRFSDSISRAARTMNWMMNWPGGFFGTFTVIVDWVAANNRKTLNNGDTISGVGQLQVRGYNLCKLGSNGYTMLIQGYDNGGKALDNCRASKERVCQQSNLLYIPNTAGAIPTGSMSTSDVIGLQITKGGGGCNCNSLDHIEITVTSGDKMFTYNIKYRGCASQGGGSNTA